MRHRTGFTLVETLLAVIIVGVLTLMAYPRISSAMVKSNVRGAGTRIVSMLATARAAATQGNRSTWLTFDGNLVRITASPRRKTTGTGTLDTLGTADLNTLYKTSVTVSGGVTQIAYDPRGLATGFGTGTTITLARDGYTHSVLVDKLGRVSK